MLFRTGLLSAMLIQTLTIINGQDCQAKFQNGKEDFVVDIGVSVQRGAALIASPTVVTTEDCVNACCQLNHCNVVLVEKTDAGTVCSLFNCLYKQAFACRFVRKKGFSSFVLDSVYEQHLEAPATEGKAAGPVAFAGRNVVVRPGEEVTLRGVESRPPADATITSYKWTLQKGDSTVVMQVTADQLLVSNLKPGTYDFELLVTDSKSQVDEAKVSIQVLDQEDSDMYCLAVKEVGLCRASFTRWHYNVASLRCEQFIYGGCKGNHNNYVSEKECGVACANVKAPTGRSIQLPDLEDCSAPCVKGQFQCMSGCCLDRSLECDGVAQCSDSSDEASCSQLNQTFSSLLKVTFEDSLARCTEPPKSGPCHGDQTVWYYNAIQQQCHPFTFSGCHGNENNFNSKEACEEECSGVTEKAVFASGRFEELEETESGSIAIAIVLAVSILVLLAVLSFFYLKRRQRAHQPVATAPPAAGEEDDTVVYRSTTKSV